MRIRHALPFVFIGNVGEEGEGDLRGMRHIFSTPRWKDSIAYSLVLDGAGADTIVAEALGSRRFEVIVRGPGGHSWSDFGAPNPIVILAKAIDTFTATTVPATPKTTFNVGVIRGGTSVNSIPESASMKVDIRSTSMTEMERLEQSLRQALNRAVEDETMAAEMRSPAQKRPAVSCEVVVIGNRPAGELQPGARILQIVRAVDVATGQRGAGAARLDRRQYSALDGQGSGRHRRRRFGRRSAYAAGVVRFQRARAGTEANSADHADAGGGGRMSLTGKASLGGAVLVCILTAVSAGQTSAPAADTKPKADVIFVHANVYTGVPANAQFASIERQEAIAVKGDRILAVGKTLDMDKFKGPQTQIVDLGGHFTMPGFNDAHLHLDDAGQTKLSVDLTGVKSLDELRSRVANKVQESRAGEWIQGSGWDETLWPVKSDSHALGSG